MPSFLTCSEFALWDKVYSAEHGYGVVSEVLKYDGKPLRVMFAPNCTYSFTLDGRKNISDTRPMLYLISPAEDEKPEVSSFSEILEIIHEANRLKEALETKAFSHIRESIRYLLVGELSSSEMICREVFVSTGAGFKLLSMVRGFSKRSASVDITADEGEALLKFLF